MEIIQERLEREFDLDLVTTLPSVIYEVIKTDGTTVDAATIRTTTRARIVIEEAREPYVKATIIDAAASYVGNIMPHVPGPPRRCSRICSIWTPIWWSCTTRCRSNEIIYDFFDALKASTKGYASLDYELVGLSPERACEGGYAAQRRSGGRAVLHRPPGQGLRPCPPACAKS